MRKTEAVRLKPGAIVYEESRDKITYQRHRVDHVTPNGGVRVTPVNECYELDEVTHRIVGPAYWLPYSQVYPFPGEVFRPAPDEGD